MEVKATGERRLSLLPYNLKVYWVKHSLLNETSKRFQDIYYSFSRQVSDSLSGDIEAPLQVAAQI
jgi:CBS domain-containing protein